MLRFRHPQLVSKFRRQRTVITKAAQLGDMQSRRQPVELLLKPQHDGIVWQQLAWIATLHVHPNRVAHASILRRYRTNSRRAATGQIASTLSPRQAYKRSYRFTFGSQCGTMNSSRSPMAGSETPFSAVMAPNSSPFLA